MKKNIVFIVLAVIIFSLLIFAIYKLDFLDVVGFLPSMFEQNEGPVQIDHSEKVKEIMDLLEKEDVGYEVVDTDTGSLISMLAATETDTDYHHVYTVKYSSGDSVLWKNVDVTKADDSFTIIEKADGKVVKTVIFVGGNYTVQDNITGEAKVFDQNSNISFDSYTYLTPISEIRELLVEYEKAENDQNLTSRISDCKIELVRSQSANIISLSFKYDDTDQLEEYMIHLDYGVILSAKVSAGGSVYYEVNTSVFDPE